MSDTTIRVLLRDYEQRYPDTASTARLGVNRAARAARREDRDDGSEVGEGSSS